MPKKFKIFSLNTKNYMECLNSKNKNVRGGGFPFTYLKKTLDATENLY